MRKVCRRDLGKYREGKDESPQKRNARQRVKRQDLEKSEGKGRATVCKRGEIIRVRPTQ